MPHGIRVKLRSVLLGAVAMVAVVGLAAGAALAKATLTVYTAVEADDLKKYAARFNEDHPDIEIKWVRDSTGVVTAKLLAEKANPQADVIWGLAATSLLVLKPEGLLLPYAPKGLDRLDVQFRDKDNPPAWVGMDAWVAAICFNTIEAQKKNLPKPTSWKDLTKPVYKGQIVMPNPASSGTGYLSVVSVLQRMGEAEGWKYLDALDKNIAEYTKSGSKPCKDSAAGERAIGVSFEYVAHEMIKKGSPVEMVLPKEGSGYEIEANGLTKKGAKNPAAKQFLDWAITDESLKIASQFFAAVSVPGFPVPEGLPKDISKVVFPNDFDWSAKNRDRILAEWQKRYAK